MEDTSDPRVEDSIPTDVLDGTETEQAAEIVVDAAIRNTMSPQPWAECWSTPAAASPTRMTC